MGVVFPKLVAIIRPYQPVARHPQVVPPGGYLSDVLELSRSEAIEENVISEALRGSSGAVVDFDLPPLVGPGDVLAGEHCLSLAMPVISKLFLLP
jgi:hypothetical protein